MSRIALLIALVMCGPARSAGAAPPETTTAKHLEAVKLYERDQVRRAVRLWLEAHREHPHWTYALNLTRAYFALGDDLASWTWSVRAQAGRIPADRSADREDLLKAQATCVEELRKTHAELELTVAPAVGAADAVVTLNGTRWGDPTGPGSRVRGWVPRGQSELRVTWRGDVVLAKTWTHRIGQSTRESLDVGAARRGSLAIRGEPAGARVTVDGVRTGRLPVTFSDIPGNPDWSCPCAHDAGQERVEVGVTWPRDALRYRAKQGGGRGEASMHSSDGLSGYFRGFGWM